jgi:UDP-GlcNAc:undecaprenyl-phosphate GlcNAc-1-phosphate transferase
MIAIVIIALSALMLSLLLNRAMIHIAPALGLMDQPGDRRVHSNAVPRAGGIAIWISFMTAVSLGLLLGVFDGMDFVNWEWFCAFAAGSTVLIVVGVIDDRKGLKPLVKLAGHILAPALYSLIHPVSTGLFPEDWPQYFDSMVVICWSVILINAFNLIDGLDGLCGGLATISALSMAFLALSMGHTGPAVVLFFMGASLIGFLRYNFNPARIFLGDAGSMLLGFFLATVATQAVGRRALVGVLLLPIAIAGVPLLDVLLAVCRRSLRRLLNRLMGHEKAMGLFDADSDHLHHRIFAQSGSQRKAAVVLHGLAIVLTILAFLPMFYGDRVLGLSLVGFLVVALVGLRNMARIEVEQIGSVVHMAIKLPLSSRRMALLLFFYDLLVFFGAGFMAWIAETSAFTHRTDPLMVMKFILIFAVSGLFSIHFAKIHARLWVRATIADMISLHLWILASSFFTFTIFSLGYTTLEWSLLRVTLMSYLFAAMSISLPRAFLNMAREYGSRARYQGGFTSGRSGMGPVVIIGAGDMGTLLLDHLKSCQYDQYQGLKVLGFIDQQAKILKGRFLRSLPILGDLSVIPELVEKNGLEAVILALENPNATFALELRNLLEKYDLKIYRWNVGLHQTTMDQILPTT